MGNKVNLSGGAREIVGDPTGWTALDQEEPDFDEQIIFSDEDDDSSKVDLVGSNATTSILDKTLTTNQSYNSVTNLPEQIDTTRPPPLLHPTSSELGIGTGRVGVFPSQMKSFFVSHDSFNSQHGQSSLSQKFHVDNSKMTILPSWATSTHDLSLGTNTNSFISPRNTHFCGNVGGPFIQPNISTHGHSGIIL